MAARSTAPPGTAARRCAIIRTLCSSAADSTCRYTYPDSVPRAEGGASAQAVHGNRGMSRHKGVVDACAWRPSHETGCRRPHGASCGAPPLVSLCNAGTGKDRNMAAIRLPNTLIFLYMESVGRLALRPLSPGCRAARLLPGAQPTPCARSGAERAPRLRTATTCTVDTRGHVQNGAPSGSPPLQSTMDATAMAWAWGCGLICSRHIGLASPLDGPGTAARFKRGDAPATWPMIRQ